MSNFSLDEILDIVFGENNDNVIGKGQIVILDNVNEKFFQNDMLQFGRVYATKGKIKSSEVYIEVPMDNISKYNYWINMSGWKVDKKKLN